MSNVISLSRHQPHTTKAARIAALAHNFAKARRSEQDVYWLKENAEFLNITECTGQTLDEAALDAYAGFYGQVAEQAAFFPQYYRFLTSITLDLEDMGMSGQTGQALCQFVQTQGLAEAELSDLQRAEAQRLLARRGVQMSGASALQARLHRFINRSASFALPNRKAAYELTHIVFYLSEYGRRDPQLSQAALQSLHFAGIIAYLEENADLLAEVCVALRYAAQTPPQVWENWVQRTVQGFARRAAPGLSRGDHYHEYLVANWACAQAGQGSFIGPYAADANCAELGFLSPVQPKGALRAISEALFDWPAPRQADWGAMQAPLSGVLSAEMVEHLCLAAASSPEFEAFFEHFSRARRLAGAPNPPVKQVSL